MHCPFSQQVVLGKVVRQDPQVLESCLLQRVLGGLIPGVDVEVELSFRRKRLGKEPTGETVAVARGREAQSLFAFVSHKTQLQRKVARELREKELGILLVLGNAPQKAKVEVMLGKKANSVENSRKGFGDFLQIFFEGFREGDKRVRICQVEGEVVEKEVVGQRIQKAKHFERGSSGF